MDVKPEFGKVVIFGVGLIGGSFALALKAAEQVEEVVGFGRSLATLTQALDLGIIDRVGANAGQEVADADLVLIATPVGQMPEIMERIAPYLGPETVVTEEVPEPAPDVTPKTAPQQTQTKDKRGRPALPSWDDVLLGVRSSGR